MRRRSFIFAGMFLLWMLLSLPTGLAEQEKLPVTSLDMLGQPGITIAVGIDTPAESALKEDYPQATQIPYSDIFLAYLDVAKGRVDACVSARREMEFAIDHGLTGVRLLDENYFSTKIAVGISPASPIPNLKEQLNAFIAEKRADGTLDDMYDRWVIRDEETMPDIPGAENPSFTLRVGTTGNVMPYSYYVGTELAGYDIELAQCFASWLGAGLEFKVYDFGGIIPAAEAGSIDCIMSNLFYTEEKEEAIPFSDVLFEVEITAMVREDGKAAQGEANGDKRTSRVAAPAYAAYAAYAAYNGKRIGVLTGPLMEDTAKEYFPDSEYLIYNSYPDCITALLTGKIDAYLGDEPGLKAVHAEQPEIDYIHERITENNYSFAFRKNDPESAALCAELNEFLAKCWADGTMDKLDDIWFGVDEDKKVVDMSDLTGENGTIRVVTTSTDAPFSYIKDGKNVGYDIDLVVRFCRDRCYALELGDVNFAGRIPAIKSGKYDFTTDMNVTPEREEEVLFSDPTSKGGIVLAVKAADLGADSSSASDDSDDGIGLTLDDIDGKRIGVLTGTISGRLVETRLPNAQVNYFNTQTDSLAALKTGKIDAWCTDEPIIRFMKIECPELLILDEYLAESNLAAIFPKTEAGQALCSQYNDFLNALWADGTMAEIDDVWFGDEDAKRTVTDYGSLPATNGTLHMAADLTQPPFTYMKDNRAVGYDIDVAARFCQEYGYGLVIEPMSFDGVLAAVQSGKCDFASSCITITEERAESVLFSVPNYYGGIVMATWNENSSVSTTTAQGVYTSLAQLDGKRIGVKTGTTFDEIVLGSLPEAQISYFNSYPDMAAALEANKIDGFPGDEPVLRLMAAEDDKLTVLDETMDSFEFGFVLPKTDTGNKLLSEINSWLAEIKASGELDEVVSKWTDGAEADKTLPDYVGYPAPNGTLTMATEGAYAPMNYYRGDEVVGFEIDLAARFCEANGYGLKVEAMNFDGILPAVQAGKADFAAAGITITEERAESVNFSEPYYVGGTAMVVLKSQGSANVTYTTQPEYTDFSDLSGKTVSMLTGAPFEELVSSKVPDVGEFSSFNNMPDMVLALKSGKTDAFLINNAIATLAVNRDPEIALFPQNLQDGAFGLAFAKGDTRRDDWQAAFDAIPQETIEAAWDKWTGADESVKVLPAQDWPGENGTVRVAACDTLEPMSYMGGDGELRGFDLEVILMIAREMDVHVEFSGMEFAAILSSVQSGKADIGAGSIIITEERAQAVDFVEYYPAAFVLIVRAKQAEAAEVAAAGEPENVSAQSGIAASFNKTFIREDRWKLFLDGVLTTLLITLLTILFGTILGFGVFMLCRNGNPVANVVTRFCLWLVQGMPMVVLLMILYYVIFGSVAISGIAVAVIGFTLTFGASVFGLLKMGVGAVDNGQYEAAYALGYSNRRTFFRIILPQALPHVLPAYKGEIVGLIKATAIVGYIAVQDLTKMGDIVRSRTYEAFFPLIAVTIIYFVLEGLIGFLVSRISVSFNPKRRKPADILKGVKTDD